MTDGYVIFWYNSDSMYDRHEYETFDTLAEAQATLAGWAVEYPWNTYTLAKVVGHQEATADRPMTAVVTTYP